MILPLPVKESGSVAGKSKSLAISNISLTLALATQSLVWQAANKDWQIVSRDSLLTNYLLQSSSIVQDMG